MKATYEIVVDDGKPYAVSACGWRELKARLAEIHEILKDGFGDCHVYASDQDISETVFVREIVDEILESEE